MKHTPIKPTVMAAASDQGAFCRCMMAITTKVAAMNRGAV